MGVQGLWELLAPVGRRVSVETLSGKTLAIDASIWMVQFMKAMRDDKGEMVRNAHILGFFRRICKLMYLRTKPVFVFDGGTPALKRRTVMARRRQRENAQAKIRKTAEKLLLNQLKAIRLKELKTDLENQRKMNKNDGVETETSEYCERSEIHETQGQSARIQDIKNFGNEIPSSVTFPLTEVGKEDVEKQYEQNKTKYKGKEIMLDAINIPNSHIVKEDRMMNHMNQQELDEMLVASLTAEDYENIPRNEPALAAPIDFDEEGEEEMILPVHGKVDPSILASLPPSVQLELLVQMREKLMAENRQRYQRVKKAPEKFSELQIETYLKTVAFRKEIDEVQKAATNKVAVGVQTSRIASEPNRDFIFSSSFAGDKGLISGVSRPRDEEQIPSEKASVSTSMSNLATDNFRDVSGHFFHGENEPYFSSKGDAVFDRVTAIEKRMTRDLKRNLDMMKEIESGLTHPTNISNAIATGTSDTKNDTSIVSSSSQTTLSKEDGISVQISFDVEENKLLSSDEDIFTRLASGKGLEGSSVVRSMNNRRAYDSESESDWEKGDRQGSMSWKDNEVLLSNFRIFGKDAEVEWEDGFCDDPERVRLPSKGDLEEDADLREAIRRSLDNLEGMNVNCGSLHHEEDDMVTEPFFQAVDGQNPSDELVQSPIVIDSVESGKADILRGTEKPDTVTVGCSEKEIDPCCTVLNTDTLDGSVKRVQMFYPEPASEMLPNVTCTGFPKLDENESEFASHNVYPSTPSISATCFSEGLSPRVIDKLNGAKETDQLCNTSPRTSNAQTSSSFVDTKDTVPACEPTSAEAYNSGEMEDHVAYRVAEPSSGKMDVIMDEFDLDEEIQLVEKEYKTLGNQQRKLERNADSVNNEMFAECQELLQMFGIPYIIAPMEAEAQCAFMEVAGLVDGIVTDDSDVFLFGGRSVYKNIFDDRKYVETYFMKDIEEELGLNRNKLIRMALLLGSDYTEGVSGVGIVNAIEIVNAFSEEDGLHKFRKWIESPDPTILGEFAFHDGSNHREQTLEGHSTGREKDKSAHEVDDITQNFMDKHRNVSNNWHIPPSFPCETVVSAYCCAQVDKSTESFSWGRPDHLVLQRLCWEKFGWDIGKSNELLLPVLKEYSKHENQLRLEAFYTFNERFAKIRSKRIKQAVKGIVKTRSTDLSDDEPEKPTKSRKNKSKSCDRENVKLSKVRSGSNRSSTRRSKIEKRNADAQTSTEKEAGLEEQEDGGERKKKGKQLVGGASGKVNRSNRGKKFKLPRCDETNSSSGDESDVGKLGGESSRGLKQPRRSRRMKPPANYSMNDLEDDDEEETIRSRSPSSDEVDARGVDQTMLAEPAVASPNRRQHGHEGMSSTVCSAEDEGDAAGLNPSSSPCELDSSSDYLTVGGGFCIGETTTCPDQLISGRTLKPTGTDADAEIPSQSTLKPMPFLKRKRKTR